jgi:hypothetical protein
MIIKKSFAENQLKSEQIYSISSILPRLKESQFVDILNKQCFKFKTKRTTDKI